MYKPTCPSCGTTAYPALTDMQPHCGECGYDGRDYTDPKENRVCECEPLLRCDTPLCDVSCTHEGVIDHEPECERRPATGWVNRALSNTLPVFGTLNGHAAYVGRKESRG